ncbi:sulfatase family protein, partial [Vibrio parahaemolyticus VP2007-007]
IAFSRGC